MRLFLSNHVQDGGNSTAHQSAGGVCLWVAAYNQHVTVFCVGCGYVGDYGGFTNTSLAVDGDALGFTLGSSICLISPLILLI